jgi:hypothetical protein
MHLRRILAAVALVCAIASPCHAQKTKAQLDTEITNSYPDNHAGAITPQVLRNVSSDVVNSIMPTAPVVSGNNACFDGTTGLLKDCGQAPTSITLNQGSGVSLTGTCSGSSVNCTIAVNAGTQVVYPSRAIAKTLNLSSLSAITTQGYATPGDGGGATFKNIGSTPFQDSYVTGASITSGGSGYTNGTYLYISLTGGTGQSLKANIVVSGGVVTTVIIVNGGGSGYTVGDTVTASASLIGGTGSGFVYTISSVSTPSGSFTDSAGTHWQYVIDQNNFINIRQFGAVQNWTVAGGDSAATNDFQDIQNALIFAANAPLINGTTDAGGIAGMAVYVPPGVSLVCGGSSSLIVYGSTKFFGAGPGNSGLKMCDSGMNPAIHFLTLCDPAMHVACFGAYLGDMELYADATPTAANLTAMVYTNNDQQLLAMQRVSIYSGNRMCLYSDTGFGGAANFVTQDIFCTYSNTTPQGSIVVSSYGGAYIVYRNWVIETGGSGSSVNGLGIIAGAVVVVDSLHSEGTGTVIFVDVTSGNATISDIHNVTGGFNCTNLLERQGGSFSGGIVAGALFPNGCTNTTNNGGTVVSGNVVANVTF